MINSKISVCIPVYNCENYIGDAISSILNQTYQNFELIIIDNHSSDGTIDEVKKFSDDRIKIILNSENIGLLNNWNKCLKLSSGEFIKILCADDILEIFALEKMINEFEKDHTLGIVLTNFDEIDSKNNLTKKMVLTTSANYKICKGSSSIKDIIKFNKISCCPSLFMIRISVVKNLGFFEPLYNGNIYASDLEFVIKVIDNYNGYFISDTLAKIRIHNDQSGVNYKHEEKSFLSYYKEFYDFIIRKYDIRLNMVDNIAIDYKLAKSGFYSLAGEINKKNFVNVNIDLLYMIKKLNLLSIILAISLGILNNCFKKLKRMFS